MRTHSTQAAFIRKLPIRYVYIEIGLREMQHATRDEKTKGYISNPNAPEYMSQICLTVVL